VSALKTVTTEVAEPRVYQQLREHCAYLQMTAAAEPLARVLDRARTERVSTTQVLEELLGVEVEATQAGASMGGGSLLATRCTRHWRRSTSTSSPTLIGAWLQHSPRIGLSRRSTT
jgi:hypothetical protein